MYSVGFEPAIPAHKLPPTVALDRSATGISTQHTAWDNFRNPPEHKIPKAKT